MTPALIVQLITVLGPSAITLISGLIAKIEAGNQPVTAAEWAALIQQSQVTAKASMTSALKAAGIDPASAQGAAILALVP